jgi:hypothetical protein
MAVWEVVFADAFEPDFAALEPAVQDELLAQARVIEEFGPLTKRPRVDTLKGSRYANMKELRFAASGGEWRIAFAFDPRRRAVIRVAGDKSGRGGARGQKTFYDGLIARADARFDAHLGKLRK